MNFEAMIKRFQALFGLEAKNDFLHHEAVHVMTGFGIHTADEVRVSIIQYAANKDLVFDELRPPEEVEGNVHRNLTQLVPDLPVVPSTLIDAEMQALCRGTQRLDPREVEALHDLGCRIFDDIEKRLGKPYLLFKPEDICAMKLEDHDYIEEAQAIKARFEKPENKLIEEKLLNAFARVAKEMPRPGQSWRALTPAHTF